MPMPFSRSTTLRLAAVLLWVGVPQLSQACTAEEARAQATRLMRAAASFDAATVIDLTHPAVFSASGDPAAARERLRSVYASLKAGGLAEEFGMTTLEDVRFNDARVFRAGPSMSGAYLPYRAVQRAHGSSRPAAGWLLGVCSDGRWRFAEGRRMDGAAIRRFLPAWHGDPPLPSGISPR
jgi:hypothetical protein